VKNWRFLSVNRDDRDMLGLGDGIAANRRTDLTGKPWFRRHCLQVKRSFDRRGAMLRHAGRAELNEAMVTVWWQQTPCGKKKEMVRWLRKS
jgi:hypothetical protein